MSIDKVETITSRLEAKLARMRECAKDFRDADTQADRPIKCGECKRAPCESPDLCRLGRVGLYGERRLANLDKVEPHQVEAAEALREWLGAYLTGDPAGRRSWMVHGKTGVGKTWLVAAIIAAVAKAGRSAEFVEVRELLLDIRRTFGSTEVGLDSESKLIRRCYAVDVLALNDPPRESVSPHVRSVIEAIIDDRNNMGRPIFIASNLDADGWLENYGDPIYSRLGERYFFWLRISGPDLRRPR